MKIQKQDERREREMKHIVDQAVSRDFDIRDIKIEDEKRRVIAVSIINLLCEADVTISTAASILQLCEESLYFTQLRSPKEI